MARAIFALDRVESYHFPSASNLTGGYASSTSNRYRGAEEPSYSNEIVKNRVQLCEKFITAVKKCRLPVLSELWWFYEYQFLGNSLELNLCHADEIEVEDDEISIMTSTVEHTLITVECDYLTVEQYAALHDVEPVTVRQWIRWGKLRHAKKSGRDWLIPDTEDRPGRGFTSQSNKLCQADLIQAEIKLEMAGKFEPG